MPSREFGRLFLGYAARGLADLLSPARCSACDDPVPAGHVFCVPCNADCPGATEEVLSDGTLLVPARRYAGAAGRAVRRLKYAGRSDLARPLGALVATALERSRVGPIDCLVPVPLHPIRLSERWYNQAALIAVQAASILRIGVEPRGLERLRSTREQAALDREERLANVSSAFGVRRQFEGVRVVLVDDVVTTGATVCAGAEALRRGGACVLGVACVARADAQVAPAAGA